ncbi:MAG: PQQ-binding-like beta-propeller repeat protein [Anaerolineae bacterium]|nr:PQQ-binding-like beta-propeller repeat protein [Anaerolineae bacterium]
MLKPSIIGVLVLTALLLAACTGAAGDSWAGLARDPEQSIVYVSWDQTVVAIDTTTGEDLWKYPEKDDRDAKFYAVPVIDNGTMYVGDYKGSLHSVNLEDGTRNWVYEPDRNTLVGPVSSTPSDRVISGVALNGDKVFFGLGSRNVVAVSRETAEEVWTFETNHGVWSTPLYIVGEDGQAILYVASLDHYLYALDPETGDQLWRKDLGGAIPGDMLYDPVLNRIYLGTFLSELVAVDLATQEIVAQFDTKGWLWGRPALEVQEDGTRILYFGDLEGYVYAVQITENGFEELWRRDVADKGIRSTPLLVGDMVIVGSQNKRVYALSKTDGDEEWDAKLKGEVLAELVSVPGNPEDEVDTSDLVIVSTTDGDDLVVAYKSVSGERVWRYKD